ncbi:MAG: hypothetical protein V1787_03015 [Candidatus Micrarchaeota archaeon]
MALFGIDDSTVIILSIIAVIIIWQVTEWRAPEAKRGSEWKM